MSDSSLILLGLAIILGIPGMAIAALVLSLGARARIDTLERETRALAAQIAAMTGQTLDPASAASDQPPLAAMPSVPTDEAATVAATPPPLPPEASQAPSDVLQDLPPPEDATVDTSAPPPLPPLNPQPRPRRSFEEAIGTRWTVWVGGLALAFGGIFLVKYSIDAGYFTPPFRIALAAMFACALIGSGEYLRRRGQDLSTGAPIPSILTAAGTIAAFATVYAAYALYGLIGDATAFILLGLVAVATMLAALLHGPWIATLGILGAYATPLLIDAKAPDLASLVAYLLAVTLAGFGVARVRLWHLVALWVLALALVWGVLVDMLLPAHIGSTAFAVYVAGLLVLASGFLVAGLDDTPEPPEDRAPNLPGLAALAGIAMLSLIDLYGADYDRVSLAVAVLVVLTALGLAWRYPAMAIGPVIAGLFTVLALANWIVNLPATLDTGVMVQDFDGIVRIRPNLVTEFAGFAAIAAALFLGICSLGAARATPQADRTSGWLAGSAAFTPMLILIVAWLRIDGWVSSFLFSGLGLALAIALGALTSNLILRERSDQPSLSVAIAAIGTIAALGASLTIALDKGALTIALVLIVAGIAWVNAARPIRVLRPLAALIGLIVLARVFYDPRIVGNDLGVTPVFNWLLYGYGVPALAFGYAARAFRRQIGDVAAATDIPIGVLEALTIVFTALLFVFELHHYMHDGHMLELDADVAELGLIATMGLAGAMALARVARRARSIVLDAASIIGAVLTGLVVLGLLTGGNPAFTGDKIGDGLVVNDLLPGYLVPAVAAALAAWTTRRGPKDLRANLLAVMAVALSFAYVTLMTRHVYQGEVVSIFGTFLAFLPHTSDAEIWAYSVVWLVYGIAALAIGGVARSPFARAIAAAIIVLTVAKVFLFDMSALTGIFRALSFIALGVVLIAIGYVYQKWLFKRPA